MSYTKNFNIFNPKSIFLCGLAIVCLLYTTSDFQIDDQNIEKTIKISKITENSKKSKENDEFSKFSKFVKNYSTLSKSEQQEIRSISWAFDRIDERKQKVNELNHQAFIEQKITTLPDIVIGSILEFSKIKHKKKQK